MIIGIVAKSEEIMNSAGAEVCQLISKSGNRCAFFDKNFIPNICDAEIFYEDDFFIKSDCIIVLGGDGTLLKIAVKAAQFEVPVLGINFGRIGLLMDMERDELTEILKSKIEALEYAN